MAVFDATRESGLNATADSSTKKRNTEGSFTGSLSNVSGDNTPEENLSSSYGHSVRNDSGYANQNNLEGSDENEFSLDPELSGTSGGISTAALTELSNTAGSVAQKYLQVKLDRLKDAWKKKVYLTVGSLIGEVSPYVTNTKVAFPLLADKIDDLVRYMSGVNDSGGNTLAALVDDLGTDFLEYMMSDPAMQESLMNLETVKIFGKVLQTYSKIETTIATVMNKIEPLIPPLQIFTNIVLSYFSGGASATEAAQELTELTEHYCQQLITWSMGVIKKYVYSIKVPLPSLVVGALNSISVREAMLTADYKNDWLKSIFDSDFYEQTMYNVRWQDSINEAVAVTLGSFEEKTRNLLSFNFTNSKGEPITRGEFMKSKFMSTLTSSFMSAARASARKTAYLDHQKPKTDPNDAGKGGVDASNAEHDADTPDTSQSRLDRALKASYARAVQIRDLETIKKIASKLSENN